MAKISNSKPKNSSDAYNRLFGNVELGKLISKVQSAVISSGTELEKIINNILKEREQLINDVDKFLDSDILKDNAFYALPKKSLKKSEKINIEHEPDFVLLKIEKLKKHCYIIELKDGHVFDTKKAAAEKINLQKFEDLIAKKIQYTTSIHICCFNQLDKKQIIAGFKSKFLENEVLTGKEFCELLSINYNDIISIRLQDQKENLEYFIMELLNIPKVKDLIIKNLNSIN